MNEIAENQRNTEAIQCFEKTTEIKVSAELTVDLGRGLILRNPVLLASGTVSFGEEIAKFVPLSKVGGIVTKAVSPEVREGNPPQRIVETPSGMLNAIGLANVGVERFATEKLPFLKAAGAVAVVNVVGKSIEDYIEVVARLEKEEGIAGYEINLSCPNVKGECIIFGVDIGATAEIVSALRAITKRHLMIKLTPNVTSIASIALAAEKAGADSVSLINTLIGMAVDVRSRKPKLKNVTGGLSGPAIKPIALAKVWEVFQAVQLPIVGMGGIASTEDALEFMLVGAKAVQLGTMNFVTPSLGLQIAEELCAFFERESMKNFVGSLKV